MQLTHRTDTALDIHIGVPPEFQQGSAVIDSMCISTFLSTVLCLRADGGDPGRGNVASID